MINDSLCKLSMEIKLVGEKGLTINIIHLVKSTTLNNIDEKLIFNNQHFIIWTYSNFFFGENELRLPEKRFYNYGINIHTHYFFSDNNRKEFLKSLYKSLIRWSDNEKIFQNKTKGKLVVNDKNWILY
jgi:hypothetical protein